MDFFNHVQKVYTETNYDTLNLDIPLAIFMIKLLSIKVDFSHFRDENKFNEYMKSDRPLKLRYYLQVKFRDEMTKATEVAKQEWVKEKAYIEECFRSRNMRDRNPIPPFEKRTELYDKYLKDNIFDEDTQDKISKWIEPDMVNGSLNAEMIGLINMEIRKKYFNSFSDDYNGSKHISRYGVLILMSKFSDRGSVEKLLYSMRDVYILGLV
jgi:hypothetical protein